MTTMTKFIPEEKQLEDKTIKIGRVKRIGAAKLKEAKIRIGDTQHTIKIHRDLSSVQLCLCRLKTSKHDFEFIKKLRTS